MRYGVREIANVMLKAKVDGQKVGNQVFDKHQPICHFSSLKTSTVEGAATTVYATGGRGNARLIAWEGERTLTMTMEDALISPMGIAILTGAGLIEGTEDGTSKIVHITETVDGTGSENSYQHKLTYAPKTDEGYDIWYCALDDEGNPTGRFYKGKVGEGNILEADTAKLGDKTSSDAGSHTAKGSALTGIKSVFVDYYYTTEADPKNVMQIDIEPGKFGGNYYLEAETLFRDESTGRDDAAEFILPNCKIQSNFTFTMASSGDPSTFTFTVDAFPGVVRGTSKKVLCAIQIIAEEPVAAEDVKDDYWTVVSED